MPVKAHLLSKKRKKSIKKDIRKRKIKKPFLSLRTKLLFSLGFFLIIIPSFYYLNETVQLAFFTPKVPVIKNTFARPVHITIPAIYLNLPIEEEAISRGAWQISAKGISHLNTSARPGEKGPIILYGHNTDDRFGPIRWLKIGAKITIKTIDGKTHIYKIVKTQGVSPSQINFLTNVQGEMLVLYTCDGFADLQRFLVFAAPLH